MAVALAVIGAACLLYLAVLCLRAGGLHVSYGAFWLVLGKVFIILGVTSIGLDLLWPTAVGWAIAVVCLAVVLWGLAKMRGACKGAGIDQVQWAVVLGCAVRGGTVSPTLAHRLDTAFELWRNNTNLRIIVSGGKGPGEDMTEAAAMASYLAKKGIPSSAILLEDTSTNTNQNLRNSLEIIGDKDAPTAVVTSWFHLYRALDFARWVGFRQASGVGAPAPRFTLVHNVVRESFAILASR